MVDSHPHVTISKLLFSRHFAAYAQRNPLQCEFIPQMREGRELAGKECTSFVLCRLRLHVFVCICLLGCMYTCPLYISCIQTYFLHIFARTLYVFSHPHFFGNVYKSISSMLIAEAHLKCNLRVCES